MKKNIYIFCLLISILLESGTEAQVGSWKHYGLKEGLPANTIYSITQDKKGFIWIGTEAGLVRFDGSDFKTFTTKDGLPDNEIISVTADSLDRVWITPFKKNICFIKDGIIHTEKNDTLLAHITKNVSSTCTWFVGKNNRIWIFSKAIFRISNNEIKRIELPLNDFNVRWIEDISDKEFMVYTTTRFLKYKNYLLVDSFEVRKNNYNYKININVQHNLVYFSTHDSIIVFEKDHYNNFHLSTMYMQKGYSFSNCIAVDHNLYIPSIGYGTYICDNINSPTPKFNFLANHSNSIFKDRDNNIWIATVDNGLLFQQNIKSVVTINNNNGLLFDNVGCVYADSSSNIYMGDGVGALRCFSKEKVSTIIPPLRNDNQYFKSNKIVEAKDFIAFSSDNYALIVYNKTNKKTTLCSKLSTKTFLYSSSHNKYIAGLSSGISFTNFSFPFNTIQKDDPKRVTVVCEDHKGILYCGTPEGLYKWNNTFTPLFKADDILSNRINAITCDTNNILWVRVSSGQIVAIENDKIIYEFNPIDNTIFTGTICHSLFADNRNNVWAATNNGLSKINYSYNSKTNKIELKSITPYTTIDGLADNNINDVFVRDSMVYVATSKGVSAFNYIQLAATPPPPVFITNIAINQKDTIINEEYILLHNQNNISIRYAGISFISDGKISYRYKLIGSDDQWNYTTLNQIELKSLHYGEYTFVVEALDKFGKQSSKAANVIFKIKPAFYNTILFKLLMISIMLFLIYISISSLFNIKKRKALARINIQEEMNVLKQKALRSQMNPHFIFNSLSAIQHYINQEDAKNANKYLTMFAKLIRKTLNNSDEAFISIHNEISFLENYILLEQMRFKDKFTFSITCDSNIDSQNTFIPTMLLQPFVENAIRHGLMFKENNDGILLIHFSFINNQLICTIDDNGIGILALKKLKTDSHIEYQSKGITISNERIKAINAIDTKKISLTIVDKSTLSNTNTGTLVTINIT